LPTCIRTAFDESVDKTILENFSRIFFLSHAGICVLALSVFS